MAQLRAANILKKKKDKVEVKKFAIRKSMQSFGPDFLRSLH